MAKTYTATGRLEIIGNHTDHQGGHVLAMPTKEKIYAEVSDNDSDLIQIFSEGFEPIELNIFDDYIYEQGTSRALLVGILDGFAKRFGNIQVHNAGFDAHIKTEIKPGGGTSSSAAYEILFAKIINDKHYNNQANPIELAKIGKFAENVYYGKSCGLQDQLAASLGQMVIMDFKNEEPSYELIDFDFDKAGYKIELVESNTDHADNTIEFESIIKDYNLIATELGVKQLGDISKSEFQTRLPELEEKFQQGRFTQDQLNRAIHFYNENERVVTGAEALKRCDVETFLQCVNESTISSENLLKNILPKGVTENNLSKLIAEYRAKNSTVAIKLQGGGFGGNILVFSNK